MRLDETKGLTFAISLVVLGLVIAVSTLLGGSALTMSTRHGTKLFNIWFRHLTNWNALLTSIWFLFLASVTVSPPNKTTLAFGYTVVLLNLFVFFVRWGWFRISSANKQPQYFFSDVIIHALVPLAACFSFALVAPSRPWKEQRSSVWQGIIGFWALIVSWYVINFFLERYNIVQWPYLNGAGRMLPRDIYPNRNSTRAFAFYLSLNVIVALTLCVFALVYVYGRNDPSIK